MFTRTSQPHFVRILLIAALFGRGGDSRGADEPPATSPTAEERSAAAALHAAGATLRINGQFQIMSVTLSNGDALTDDLLAHISRIKTLEMLLISGPKVSDDALQHFEGLTHLATLYLRDAAATDEGIARLQAQLPNCTIRRMRSPAGMANVANGFAGPPRAAADAAQAPAARAAAQAAPGQQGAVGRGPAAAERFGRRPASLASRFVPNDLMRELLITDVQIEIELTSQQWDALESMQADAGAAALELMQKMRSIDRESEPGKYDQTQAEMTQLTTAAEERIKVLLSAEQYHRLEQLAWHRSGPTILLDADFTADLKLDDAQLARIDEVRNRRNEGLPTTSNGQSGVASARNQFFAFGASCEEILAALTDEQRAAYEQKRGPPLERDATRVGQHVFALLDANADEQLTAGEWESADASRLLSEWPNRDRVDLPLTREDFVQGFVAARAATRSRTVPSF